MQDTKFTNKLDISQLCWWKKRRKPTGQNKKHSEFKVERWDWSFKLYFCHPLVSLFMWNGKIGGWR